MSNKHTPGPWYLSLAQSFAEIRDGSGLLVAAIETTDANGKPDTNPLMQEEVGNAHLITAAPDLLQVAKRVLDEMIKDGTYSRSQVSYDLEDAIDKAEGNAK